MLEELKLEVTIIEHIDEMIGVSPILINGSEFESYECLTLIGISLNVIWLKNIFNI